MAGAAVTAATEIRSVSYDGGGVFVISMFLVCVGSLCSVYQNSHVIKFLQ